MVELNDDTRWIMGRPNFWCASFAPALRRMGHEIARKAEDEQAVVIWWMLNLYQNHGDKWREVADRLLKEASAKSAETQESQS